MLTNICFTPNQQTAAFKFRNSQLSYCACNHNWQYFNQTCYARYGIPRPGELANATAKRHCDFIAGRHCANQAIKKLCQSPNNDGNTQVSIQPNRSPLWPKGLIGSISHSGDRAMAMVGNVDSFAGLGIDCETLLTDSAAREIADLVLQPVERELLLDRHLEFELEFGVLLTLAFSAKESLFKALSPSAANIENFLDFTIRGISADKLILVPSKRLNDSWLPTTEFSIDYIKHPKHIVTMAVIPTAR